MFSLNVVQSDIELGVVGDLRVVNSTVANIKATNSAFAAINYTISTDSNGVVLNFTGNGYGSPLHLICLCVLTSNK